MSGHNKRYGDSDDDRFFYDHYEGKDYYSENKGFERARLKIDLVIWALLIIMLLIFEFMD